MESGPSRTALGTAYLRAAHQLLDGKPPVLDDPVALRLLGSSAARRILKHAARYSATGAKGLRSHVLLRSRYAEDRLALAVSRDVTQAVFLGAGFDTFSLRQPEWASALTIFEVDHPATQGEKHRRMRDADLVLPANARLVAFDFERESLLAGLSRGGVRLDGVTFFSWLGVSMYLREAAVRATLECLASFPAGSEVVFTFLEPPADDESRRSRFRSFLADRVAAAGEPFLSRFTPSALSALCHECGFSSVGFLSAEEADRLYFAGRSRDLPVPERTGIAWALR